MVPGLYLSGAPCMTKARAVGGFSLVAGGAGGGRALAGGCGDVLGGVGDCRAPSFPFLFCPCVGFGGTLLSFGGAAWTAISAVRACRRRWCGPVAVLEMDSHVVCAVMLFTAGFEGRVV